MTEPTKVRLRKVSTFRQYELLTRLPGVKNPLAIGRVQEEIGRRWCGYDKDHREVVAHQPRRRDAVAAVIERWDAR